MGGAKADFDASGWGCSGRIEERQIIMASCGIGQLKVAVELHEGEKATKKIWRFNDDQLNTVHCSTWTGSTDTYNV